MDTTEAANAQPPLIPMSEEEITDANMKLALKIGELESMKQEHADIREGQNDERKALEHEIAAIASTIRNHGR